MITIDVRHDGLGRFQRVSAPNRSIAERRAEALKQRWEEQHKRREAAYKRGGVEALKKIEAAERTEDAEWTAAALTAILFEALRTPHEADWSPLYDTSSFAEPPLVEPVPPKTEAEPQQKAFKAEPLTLAVMVNPYAMRRRKEKALAKYTAAHEAWAYLKRWREQEHDKAMKAYRAATVEWEGRKAAFLDLQQRANARLSALLEGYGRGDPEAVIGHCDLTLLSLDRPDGFPCFWKLAFAQGALQIDYDLPSMAQVPLVKAVRYVASRDTLETVLLSEAERQRLYGEAVFQTCLAVLHTLFAYDTANAVNAISFNGWANYVDQAGIRPGRACILSVTADKQAFMAIDLASADPQACFRALNGTMSPKLAALTAR